MATMNTLKNILFEFGVPQNEYFQRKLKLDFCYKLYFLYIVVKYTFL